MLRDEDREYLEKIVNRIVTQLLSGQAVFLLTGLKLMHVIDWAWVWVIGPLWIPAVAGIFFRVLGKTMHKIADNIDKRKAEKRHAESSS